MKSHLYDTVTLPFPLLLLLPQQVIHNEKEKIIKDMSKTKKKDHWCSNTPCNDLCLNSRRCHFKSPADAQPLCLAFLRSDVFPLIFAFSNTSLQVATFNLSGSSAYNSSPACCSYHKAGGEPALVGSKRAPASVHVRATAPAVSPSSRAKRQTRRLPLFCNQPWFDAYGKRGGVPLNLRKE